MLILVLTMMHQYFCQKNLHRIDFDLPRVEREGCLTIALCTSASPSLSTTSTVPLLLHCQYCYCRDIVVLSILHYSACYYPPQTPEQSQRSAGAHG